MLKQFQDKALVEVSYFTYEIKKQFGSVYW